MMTKCVCKISRWNAKQKLRKISERFYTRLYLFCRTLYTYLRPVYISVRSFANTEKLSCLQSTVQVTAAELPAADTTNQRVDWKCRIWNCKTWHISCHGQWRKSRGDRGDTFPKCRMGDGNASCPPPIWRRFRCIVTDCGSFLNSAQCFGIILTVHLQPVVDSLGLFT